MNIVRFEPWNVLQREINKLFETQVLQDDSSTVETSQWIPSVDIREEPDRFILLADLPGINPKDVEVTMENNVLSIKGERHYEKKEEKKGYTRTERAMGMFYRRFTLPETVDAEHITAAGRDGVLELVIPKREKAHPRKIDIKVTH